MIDFLLRLAVFEGIPPTRLTRLSEQGRRRTFAADTCIIKQGEPSTSMYIILRGKVRVEREHPQLIEPVLIAEIEAGEPVGEMGLLDPAPRSATVTTNDETEVLELSAEALRAIIDENPKVSRALFHVLTRRLRTTDELAAALLARKDG